MGEDSTVLVIEDEAGIAKLIASYLERDGHDVVSATSGEEGMAALARGSIDLVVLDLGLPGMDGLEVCRRVAEAVPVIVVTARGEESERVEGLERGADDYVTKPFSPRELVARVNAVLRRRESLAPSDPLLLGDVAIDPGSRAVEVAGDPVRLTPKEFDLLLYLAARPGRVVSRRRLLEEVWGFLAPGETRTVEVHVGQVRKKLGRPELIETVHSVGYRVSD